MGQEELEELKVIKKLLMLSLIKAGTNSEELAVATGMGASTIRKMFPSKKLSKLSPKV
ncbi:MAG: hypothetical protein GY800_04780 [Planctomycetes bacterium]|nr:hypothetical protein [Planctomycetota bacterium]